MATAARSGQGQARRRLAGHVLLHAILIVGALATLVPLGWMVAASFMTAGEAAPDWVCPSSSTSYKHTGEA
jgi:ABC-type glycerol-3-phosphate transport system permease component